MFDFIGKGLIYLAGGLALLIAIRNLLEVPGIAIVFIFMAFFFTLAARFWEEEKKFNDFLNSLPEVSEE